MTYAAALSQHPSPAEAVGEVVGSVLEQLGPAPDLAVLFLSAGLAGAVEDLAAAVRATLAPGTLLGATASAVIGGGREVEDGPALALWAGHTGPVEPVRIRAVPGDRGFQARGAPAAAERRTLLMLADPFSMATEGFLGHLAIQQPGLTVVGGLASAGRGPGGNRLLLDDHIHRDGAVGVVLSPGVESVPLVSPGCRPVGEPMIVTDVAGSVLMELAGAPALDRLVEASRTIGADDRALFELGPRIGIVIDERRATFGTGDFLIRAVMGGDPERRGILIGDRVEVGTTVQFHVRDAASADDELRRLLAGVVGDAPSGPPQGALVFTCNGRGSAFFGVDDHDAELVADLAGPAVAGMACAGEIGPVGGRSRLHGDTASVLLLHAPP